MSEAPVSSAVSRPVVALALLGGAVLVLGATARLLGAGDHGALLLGAAVFLSVPLARNLALLRHETRRAPRLLAALGLLALLCVYGYAALSITAAP